LNAGKAQNCANILQEKTETYASEWVWRPEPESNRRARICSPLRNHSAIGPEVRLWREPRSPVKPAWRAATGKGRFTVAPPNPAQLSMNGGWLRPSLQI
jgi:hypothetical protein